MKILYVTLENLSLHKGSVVHVKEIAEGLRKLGHQIGLVASSWDKIERSDHFYNLHHTGFFLSRSLERKRPHYFIASIFLFLFLLKILPRYDIIYARDYHTVIISLFPRLIFKKKLVFEINGLASEEQWLKGNSIRNWILAFFIQKAEKIATRYCDRVVSVTPQIASYLLNHSYCGPGKVKIVGNGVNIGHFRPIHDEPLLADWRRRLGIRQKENVIAFVGNLAPWQGVEYLIQVAPFLLEEIDNIRFLIIGDGVLKKEFESEVNKLGISDHFIFTGMIHYEQIPFYINIADICILLKQRLSSGYSPIKLYEYMACGKPVVASRVEGLEFIETEGVGRLTEPKDITSIRQVLRDLLKDRQKRINMGLKGLQIARGRFAWESKAAEIEKVLEELA